ncbi:hypothetical protein RIF29_36616 [Crotalaria pallida]|uniref:Uncharacterized protein n=1 Tax=Crotalaria pallida TaxID=3830 RepID=A0AAN9EDS3_CROPI
MASQLVSDVRCQRLMHCAASYGERGSFNNCSSLSHRQKSYGYHRIRNQHSAIQPEGSFKEHNMGHEKGANKRKGRQQAQKLHTLGFSYLATSFIYLVTKVKAFYNGFLGDAASESIEAPMTTETYFSIPVLPN